MGYGGAAPPPIILLVGKFAAHRTIVVKSFILIELDKVFLSANWSCVLNQQILLASSL